MTSRSDRSIHVSSIVRRSIALWLATGFACVARAATFCAADAAELSAALAAAENNLEADEVRIRAGVHAAPATGWSIDLGLGAHGLAVIGGYTDAACTARSHDARATVLDGGGVARPLTIETRGAFGRPQPRSEIRVSGLTFRNGRATMVGGLQISHPGPVYGGRIVVEGNVFDRNEATMIVDGVGAGGLLAATDGAAFDGNVWLVLRNNLFVGNRGPSSAAAFVFSNNPVDVVSNTYSANQAFGNVNLRTTLLYFASGIHSRNNVFWGNNPARLPNTVDLELDWVDTRHDDIQTPTGTPISSVGQMQIDPQFVDAAGGDFALAAGSPLIDQGDTGGPGTLTEFDIVGAARVAGPGVDVGAYERELPIVLDPLFDDGFETDPPMQ